MLAAPALGIPFLIAGGLKIVYDLAIFAVFRQARLPEEQQPCAGALPRRGR